MEAMKTSTFKAPVSAKSSASEIVEWLKGLRSEAEEARVRLMRALRYVEVEIFPHRNDWGHDSFDGFIKQNDLVRPDVYRDFLASEPVLESMGVKAESIGVEAARYVTRVPEQRRVEYVKNVMTIADERGVKPSQGAAKAQAERCGMVVTNLAAKRVSEIDRLRTENAELRAENLKLRRELAKATKSSEKAA